MKSATKILLSEVLRSVGQLLAQAAERSGVPRLRSREQDRDRFYIGLVVAHEDLERLQVVVGLVFLDEPLRLDRVLDARCDEEGSRRSRVVDNERLEIL